MAKKKYKSKKEKSLIVIVAMVLILVGYLVSGLVNTPETADYSALQNNNGYYYYQTVGSNDYYSDTDGLIKTELVESLRIILNEDVTRTSYAEAKEYLAVSDALLDDATKVYNIYDSVEAPALWDSTSWHREHVWPNSRLGLPRVTESNRTIASDLHNLRAITPRINSSRSDRFYSNPDPEEGGLPHTTEDGGYYPGDDHRGDVARIIFYMAMMYEELTITDDLDALLDERNHYELEGARMGQLCVLLKWHKADPVDAFERNRNQVIFGYQGNRNPFIDKPEFAHLIWENKSIKDLQKSEDTVFSSNDLITLMIKEESYETYVN